MLYTPTLAKKMESRWGVSRWVMFDRCKLVKGLEVDGEGGVGALARKVEV